MADVTVIKRSHYSGADADKAGVTGKPGESYAANDSGKRYYWNDSLNAWKTGLGYEFVPRETAAPDFLVGDFTQDGTWKVDGLDLSAETTPGLVPAGAVAVALQVLVKDDAADSSFSIRQNAVAGVLGFDCATQIANIAIVYGLPPIAIDADRLLDYMGDNVAFIAIGVTVRGWWI